MPTCFLCGEPNITDGGTILRSYAERDPWVLCRTCFDSRTCECVYCGDRRMNGYMLRVTRGNQACNQCYNARYRSCPRCGDAIPRDEAVLREDCPYHPACDPGEPTILRARANPLDYLSFLGDARDRIYLGVELEVDCDSDEEEEVAEVTLDILGRDYCILKYDGSVNGFEIVSAPATLDVHRERLGRLADAVASRRQPRPRIQAGRNGLHVHVSRAPLGELNVAKLVSFVNDSRHRRQVTQMAGRGPGTYCQRLDKPVGKYKRDSHQRYSAINLLNPDTIEFRIFHSTLVRERLIARVEFVDAVCRWAKYHAGVRELAWDDFAAHVAKARRTYPALLAYMKAKDIALAPAVAR